MQQQQQQIWFPLVASIGIGAAAFYSMTRGQGTGQTLQQFIPLAAGMGGNQATQMQQNQQNKQQNKLNSNNQLQ
ncbi:hypothetical protein ACFWGC_21750 [Cytobacillus pseudoceanisediminis]|uniref:hypothetical protein n=1 Tax=Cytobacillus TaxID=2675230 RepID=UPI002117AD0D|nr:hypothetical protein [Cytobacillus sp. Bac17]